MKKISVNLFSVMFLIALIIGSSLKAFAVEPNIIAALKFDPKVNGFGFRNYNNEGRNWQDDLGTEDMIRLFGADAVCKTGNTPKNCVVKAAAREWLLQKLESMNIGHCEGMAVMSFRFYLGLPFKNRIFPSAFQTIAKSPFDLKRDQSIENYIAYYWITQTLQEVWSQKSAVAAKGPGEVVKMLVNAFNKGNETYTLSIFKFVDGKLQAGHAISPYAVEDIGTQYRIYVYDNNYPGETHYITVDKAGKQTWKYIASINPSAPASQYVGNIDTKSISLTATSLRDNRCFNAPFAKDSEKANGCGRETMAPVKPNYPASTSSKTNTPPVPTNPNNKQPVEEEEEMEEPEDNSDEGEKVEFSLTGEGEMLVVDGNGKRVGFDPKANKFFDEIPGANAGEIIGGLGEDIPNYSLPLEEGDKPYKIIFSGKDLDAESEFDFTYSAPGFTVGFENIKLDPNEILTATVSPDGENISFTSSADGETPGIFYSYDSEDDDGVSYITRIDGGELDAGKTLTADFDFENGKLFFKDNDGNEDEYDIELTRINADGTEQVYKQDDLDIGKTDNYEMDFGKWDGKGSMCFEEDDEGDGFADDKCVPLEDEEDGDEGDKQKNFVLLKQPKEDVLKILGIR